MVERDWARENYERNKLEYARRSGELKSSLSQTSRSVKSWLVGGAGVIGFLISLATAISSARVVDDLRVVLGGILSMQAVDAKNLKFRGTTSATFINAGNRAVAVTFMTMFVKRYAHDSNEPINCRPDSPAGSVSLDFKPLVVEPGKIEVISVPARLENVQEGQDQEGVISFSTNPSDHLIICYLMDYVTPDNATGRYVLPLVYDPFHNMIPTSGLGALWLERGNEEETEKPSKKAPTPILRHTKSALELYRDWFEFTKSE